MARYNGHRNWNHWNVALWLGNDEGLYSLAREYKRRFRNSRDAAKAMLQLLESCGARKTPDGAPYTVSSLQAAIAGL